MYQAHPETQDTMESQVGRVIQAWERQAVTDHLAPKVNQASKGRRVRREPQACLGVLEKTVNEVFVEISAPWGRQVPLECVAKRDRRAYAAR